METTELGYWLMLNSIPQIGPKRFVDLLAHFKSIKAVFKASPSELCAIESMNKPSVKALLTSRSSSTPGEEIGKLEATGAECITIESPTYPPLLKSIYGAPPVLFVLGDPSVLSKYCVAIVGSRRCSVGGRSIASKIARELGDMGVVVVSGMARGIDSAAHHGTLSGEGETIAVLGCGIDIVYPSENLELMHRIRSRGAVVTEFNPGTQPLAGNFPARNRVISGLSEGVIIVEGSRKSGALITGDMAMEQNREVMAIPGSPISPMSEGPNSLIKQGAGLVEDCSDVCNYLGILSSRPLESRNRVHGRDGLSDNERLIIKSLTLGEMSAQDIANETGLTASLTLSSLMSLVADGRIVEVGHSRFTLNSN